MLKRLFDILFSLIALTLLSPFIGIAAFFIKMESPGPLFLVHVKIGQGIKLFRSYRFRISKLEHLPNENRFQTSGTPRYTKIGRILNAIGMEGLPQLINVLKGNMTLLGPNSPSTEVVQKYRDEYQEILKLRPGLIDLEWLTYMKGFYATSDKKTLYDQNSKALIQERLKLAREYVKNASLPYDLRLLVSYLFTTVYPWISIQKIIRFLSPYRKTVVVLLQIGIFITANYIAFLIRFDGAIPTSQFHLFLKYLPLLIVFRTILLFTFSLDRALWRYSSVRELLNIGFSVTTGSVLFILTLRYLIGETLYPRSIYVIDWILAVFFLGGIRLFRRLHERADRRSTIRKKIIMIGAGDAADMILRDIEKSEFYHYEVAALIDDNPKKKGLQIRGVPILGTRQDLPSILTHEEVEEFIIAIPSLSGSKLEGIVKDIRQYGKPIKTLPGMYDILSGKDKLSRIKAVEPEDILFRPPATERYGDLKVFFEGKRVMITGAGGSIGSELARQIALLKIESLILFERHEENLYEIDMDLHQSNKLPSSKIIPILGDILNEEKLLDVMMKHRPNVVFHAAAYKHVPMIEKNPLEAIKTNVLGTKIVAEKSIEAGVGKFVLISTDKAVNPFNVMGMTKKLAEQIVCHLSQNNSATNFISVRFGNVLGSSGSVVPLFKEQIKRGGPLTITHPDVTRYFMTVSEAVNLVLHSVSIGDGGEVFVLNMGTPVKIIDLARRLINLYGCEPGTEIDISIVGLRPGEKLHEELFNGDEVIEPTIHSKINKAISNKNGHQELLTLLSSMDFYNNNMNVRQAIDEILQSIYESKPSTIH